MLEDKKIMDLGRSGVGWGKLRKLPETWKREHKWALGRDRNDHHKNGRPPRAKNDSVSK